MVEYVRKSTDAALLLLRLQASVNDLDLLGADGPRWQYRRSYCGQARPRLL